MSGLNRILSRGAAAFTALMLLASGRPAAAAEQWDLYVYNAVATVSPVKGMNTVIEQIEKETNGELSIRLHLGGSLQINTTSTTQRARADAGQMGQTRHS